MRICFSSASRRGRPSENVEMHRPQRTAQTEDCANLDEGVRSDQKSLKILRGFLNG